MNRGVSLVVLIITIIMILILSSIVTLNGQGLYDNIQYIKFEKQIQVIEKAIKKAGIKKEYVGDSIKNFYDAGVSTHTSKTTIELQEIISKIETKYDTTIDTQSHYLINTQDLLEIGVKNIKGEYIVNYNSGVVFSINPFLRSEEELYTVYKYIPKDEIIVKEEVTKTKLDVQYMPGSLLGKNYSYINNDFSIVMDNDGIITINGIINENAANNKAFIKLNEGINVTNSGNNITNWIKDATLIAKEGSTITQKVTNISGTMEIIDNTISEKKCNVVLRKKDNTATDVLCYLLNDVYESTSIVDEDVYISYIYITGGVRFTDYKIKVELFETETIKPKDAVEVASDIIKKYLIPNTTLSNTQYSNNITCNINSDYTVTLNGSTGSKNTFIKLSDGIEYNPGSLTSNWIAGKTIVPINTNLVFTVKEKSGTCTTTGTGEFNVCLRAANNTAMYNCKTKEGIYRLEGKIDSDLNNEIKAIYLFVSPRTVLNDYNILINVN